MRDGRLTAILVTALVLVLVGGGTTAYLVGRDPSTVASGPPAPVSTPAFSTRPVSSPPVITPPSSNAGTDVSGSDMPAPEPTTSPIPIPPISGTPSPVRRSPTTASPNVSSPSAEPPTPTAPVESSGPVEPPSDTDQSGPPTASTEVAIAGVAADDPQAGDIRDLLQRHFDSINNRDYAGWASTVTADLSVELSQKQWLEAYRTTQDTDISIIRIYRDPRKVDITFRSRQDKQYSPDGKSSCLNWKVAHPLTDTADGLRIERSITSAADWRPCSTG